MPKNGMRCLALSPPRSYRLPLRAGAVPSAGGRRRTFFVHAQLSDAGAHFLQVLRARLYAVRDELVRTVGPLGCLVLLTRF